MVGLKNSTVWFMLAMVLLSAKSSMAVLNNGFETDYFYTATRYDEIQIFDESVRVGDPEVGVLGPHGPRSITFSGTGTADARLFMLEYDDDYWNVFIKELNAAGAIVNTGDLQTLAGHGNYDGIFGQTIRFNPLGDSGAGSLMAALIEKWDDVDEPLTIYEIDLDLTTILNTYTGPMVGRVEASVAVDPLTGTLYVVAGRNSAGDPIDTTVCDDVIAFDTSGGSTSTYTTVVDASDPVYGYTAPDSVIFRSACAGNSYTPTILVVRNDRGPAREYRASDGVWVRDYEDIKDESGNFRMNAGHQDMMNLDIYISTYAMNHFIINTDNTVDNWAYGDTGWSSYRDAVSPGFGSAPVITEVTPDPDEGYANVEYTEQLTTAECFPLPTWSVTANTTAPGVQVDSNGLVSGWTPAPGDLGSSFVIEVQASNASGSDTETWQVQVEDWPPIITEVAPDPDDVYAGSEYTEQLTLQQGFHSVTWSLITWPTGAVIDPNTGLVSGWTPSDSDVNNSFNFEALASNPYGSDTEAWQVQVNAVAPTIGDIPWSPHLTQVNTEYVVQLSATGTTPITWSKVQGPAAMQIDGTGRISGWTPDLCDVGSTIPIEMKAGNLAIGGGEDTATWNVIVCSNLNNGFNLDYVYGASRDGTIRMYDENNRDSDAYIADFGGTGHTYFGEGGGRLSSITFTGTGANDARMFTLQFANDWTNVSFTELNADGDVVRTNDLQTLTGHGPYAGIYTWNLRYNPLGDSGAGSLMAAFIDKWDGVDEPLTTYEVDLNLTTILNTYTGPMVGEVESSVAVNPQTGTLYVVTNVYGAENACNDVIAFDTSGGSTSSYTTLIDHTGPNGYTYPTHLIFRAACEGNSYTPTILVGMGDNTPMKEYRASDGVWVQDHTDIADSKAYSGQQDTINLDVCIARYRVGSMGYFFLNSDNSTYLGLSGMGRLFDIASPPGIPTPPICNLVIFADSDADNDVDQNDFALFQLCYTGADGEIPCELPYCECFDRDNDNDVDNADFIAFQDCATGPNIPFDPGNPPANCIP